MDGLRRLKDGSSASASGAGSRHVERHGRAEHPNDRLGNLAEQRLELVLRCAVEAAAARNEQMLADTLAEHALLGSGYARAAVLWELDGELVTRSLRPEAAPGGAPFAFDRALVDVARGGEVARIDAAAEAGNPARYALCAPLRIDGRAIGFLYLESPRPIRRGHTDAPTFAQALARLAALALANLRRLAGEREQALLVADIERARDVQRRLLPDPSRLAGGVRYALHLHPGRAVAGDIVDVIELAGGRIAAMLGDVSGAGLGAGLIMASVQSFLRAELAHHDDPARALTRLNAHLHAQASGGRFVTLWLGIFDPASRSFRCVDAGHGHALRLHGDGSAEPLAMRGDIPLGIDGAAVFGAETLELAPAETILLYSDGVIEQRAPDGEPFGRGRLLAALRERHAPAETIAAALAALTAHAHGAPADDDTTLLAIGWSQPASGG